MPGVPQAQQNERPENTSSHRAVPARYPSAVDEHESNQCPDSDEIADVKPYLDSLTECFRHLLPPGALSVLGRQVYCAGRQTQGASLCCTPLRFVLQYEGARGSEMASSTNGSGFYFLQ